MKCGVSGASALVSARAPSVQKHFRVLERIVGVCRRLTAGPVALLDLIGRCSLEEMFREAGMKRETPELTLIGNRNAGLMWGSGVVHCRIAEIAVPAIK